MKIAKNMRIHFIQHEVFEAPGVFLTWAEKKGYQITFSRVYEFQPLPDSIEKIDMLIVMGGPQSPDTTLEECPHFNAGAEIALIQKCVREQKAVIGVCLGAQLIGNALGSQFEHSPEKEIGIFPIQLTEDGLRDEKVLHFGSSLLVGHWHSDMPGLTPECKVLAASEGCPRQIIAYSNRVYGFQCHLELTAEVVELLIAHDKDILLNNTHHRFIQKLEEILNYDYTEMNDRLCLLMDKLSSDMKTYHIKETSNGS